MFYCYDQLVDIVPVIFGHSSVDQQTYLKKITNYSENLFNNLQKVALLKMITILTLVVLKFIFVSSIFLYNCTCVLLPWMSSSSSSSAGGGDGDGGTYVHSSSVYVL